MDTNNTPINYIEFRAKDLSKIKTFYSNAFGWVFKDYGENYTAFSKSGLEGGFEKTDEDIVNGVLVVLYDTDLPKIKAQVIDCGGIITQDIFSFPGGSRFQFLDPSGNELAVWCDL